MLAWFAFGIAVAALWLAVALYVAAAWVVLKAKPYVDVLMLFQPAELPAGSDEPAEGAVERIQKWTD